MLLVVALCAAGVVLGRIQTAARKQGRFDPIAVVASKTISPVAATVDGLLTGIGGIPTVQYGPGEANAAHSPDEWVGVDEVRHCARALVQLIVEVCG